MWKITFRSLCMILKSLFFSIFCKCNMIDGEKGWGTQAEKKYIMEVRSERRWKRAEMGESREWKKGFLCKWEGNDFIWIQMLKHQSTPYHSKKPPLPLFDWCGADVQPRTTFTHFHQKKEGGKGLASCSTTKLQQPKVEPLKSDTAGAASINSPVIGGSPQIHNKFHDFEC